MIQVFSFLMWFLAKSMHIRYDTIALLDDMSNISHKKFLLFPTNPPRPFERKGNIEKEKRILNKIKLNLKTKIPGLCARRRAQLRDDAR